MGSIPSVLKMRMQINQAIWPLRAARQRAIPFQTISQTAARPITSQNTAQQGKMLSDQVHSISRLLTLGQGQYYCMGTSSAASASGGSTTVKGWS